MLNLEQIKLLETKVANAVDYVERVSGENAALLQKEAEMVVKLESYRKKEAEMQAGLVANQKRIDELEVLIMRFKDEQGQIEDGILSALDRLNRFEEAMEKSLKGKPPSAKTVKDPGSRNITARDLTAGGSEICFEISEDGTGNDVNIPFGNDVIDPLDDADALEAMLEEELLADAGNPREDDGELEIF